MRVDRAQIGRGKATITAASLTLRGETRIRCVNSSGQNCYGNALDRHGDAQKAVLVLFQHGHVLLIAPCHPVTAHSLRRHRWRTDARSIRGFAAHLGEDAMPIEVGRQRGVDRAVRWQRARPAAPALLLAM